MRTVTQPTDLSLEPLDRVVELFDAELRCDQPFVNKLTEQVRKYRGKLLRPRLLLMSGRATGDLCQEHIVLAAVVEMVHMATLVHDDVLDDATVRRRGTTINRLIGNEGAVLLGDYLISHAYHLCSSLDSTFPARRVGAVTNTVCEGELTQIHHRGDFELSESQYIEIIRRKTAALTGLCCELGAVSSSAQPDIVEHLSAYGEDIGVAFQIVDDLLDLTATESEMGKSVGRDADLGKMTLPLIRYRDAHPEAEGRRLIDVLSNGDPNKTIRVREIIADSDAIDYATGVARSYIDSAIVHLEALPDTEAKGELLAAAEFVLRRRA